MTVIVCLDDNNGMLFGGKRLSRDVEVIKRIEAISLGKKLCMDEYSKGLFNNTMVCAENDFLEKSEKEDICFVENRKLLNFAYKIERIIVFKWNRIYPSDMKFDISLKDYKLESSICFKGNSHEKITQEVYIK